MTNKALLIATLRKGAQPKPMEKVAAPIMPLAMGALALWDLYHSVPKFVRASEEGDTQGMIGYGAGALLGGTMLPGIGSRLGKFFGNRVAGHYAKAGRDATARATAAGASNPTLVAAETAEAARLGDKANYYRTKGLDFGSLWGLESGHGPRSIPHGVMNIATPVAGFMGATALAESSPSTLLRGEQQGQQQQPQVPQTPTPSFAAMNNPYLNPTPPPQQEQSGGLGAHLMNNSNVYLPLAGAALGGYGGYQYGEGSPTTTAVGAAGGAGFGYLLSQFLKSMNQQPE
jgi:hypothetical protein